MSRSVVEFIRDGWEPWSYEIIGSDGKVMMDGWARGDFAIDQRPSDNWTVTHLPTGWRVTSGKTFLWCVIYVDLLIERSPGTNWSSNDAVSLKGERLTEIAAAIHREMEDARHAGLL